MLLAAGIGLSRPGEAQILPPVIKEGETLERGKHQELFDRHGFCHHLPIRQFKGQAI